MISRSATARTLSPIANLSSVHWMMSAKSLHARLDIRYLASCRLRLCLRLQAIQVISRTLCVGSGSEDGALVAHQHLQP